MILPTGTNIRELHALVLDQLKRAGIKFRLKKTSSKYDQGIKSIFGAPLAVLPQCEMVCCGSTINIPVAVRDMSAVILREAHVEGLFRKAGSQSRQREIKKCLENRENIESTLATAVDVACVLKRLLRSLPDPIISPDVQDALLMCRVSEAKPDMMFHALLLLPLLHVHLLHHLMELLNRIASRHSENSMNATNLAIVMVPSVMPLPQAASPLRLQHHVELVKFLIDNAQFIGALPEQFMYTASVTQPSSVVTVPLASKKKKRRSASFSRVFNGICKMVSGNMPATGAKEQIENKSTNKENVICKRISVEKREKVVRDTRTPVICSATKRKMDDTSGLSSKKKLEIRNNLPSRELFMTPMKVANKRAKMQEGQCQGVFTPKPESHNTLKLPKIQYEPDEYDCKDYVKISKNEYEEIKKRVSAIETRLSQELDGLDKPLRHIQDVYERTLGETMSLNTDQWTTDRLSKGIKMRQSNKVIRSPSARKIGTVRRRSRENLANVRDYCNTSRYENEFNPYVGIRRRQSCADTVMKNTFTYDASDIMELKRKIRRCSSEHFSKFSNYNE